MSRGCYFAHVALGKARWHFAGGGLTTGVACNYASSSFSFVLAFWTERDVGFSTSMSRRFDLTSPTRLWFHSGGDVSYPFGYTYTPRNLRFVLRWRYQ